MLFSIRCKITYASGASTEFQYNGYDQRAIQIERNHSGEISSEKHLIWCGGNQPCEERDGNDVVKVRYYPSGEIREGTVYFYTKDHLGSVRELVDTSQTTRARYEYSPWGKRQKLEGDLESIVGYTGHHHHLQSDLVLTWYRQYDPNQSRWLNRDPIGESDGPNIYG